MPAGIHNALRGAGVMLAAITVMGLSSCASWRAPRSATGPVAPRQCISLDADWRFHRGDVGDSNRVIAVDYRDQQWAKVEVPHDYVLDGTYSSTNDRNHGYLPYPVAWYRKHFLVPAADRGKSLRLQFGGIFRDSQVWLNGRFLGRHPSGYTPFSYDVTGIARYGTENVITVRVDPRQFEGWWYEGGGIYRHVSLLVLSPLHVAQWGTYVIAKVPGGNQGADDKADLTIQTTVRNEGALPVPCRLVSRIAGPNGRIVKTLEAEETVPAGGQREFVQHTIIEHPQLWSIPSPQLYQLHTMIEQEGRPADATRTTFGIRTIHFDAHRGFFLNGKHVEIQGVANHQDFAGVGIAVPDSLETWRVKQLKKMGCNAWRTAHNPPDVAVLDACDRLGMLVMDENRHLGDTYLPKTPPGTGDTNLSDLAVMIQRDRNHPSVIMWSMCNEEKFQASPEGQAIFAAMIKEVHRYDRTRPVTSAIVHLWPRNGAAALEDIIGVNYNYGKYDAIHRHQPTKPMFGSEATNEKTTRGEYADDAATGMRSAYHLSEDNWLAMETRPFMCGSFTWTGFDYKGEPNPYGWPDISNNTGLMDSCGFPKDKYYYFESCWSDKPMVHVLPDSWDWPGKEGQNIRVIAFSNGQRVELFLNHRPLGTRTMPHDGHVEWEVPYQPGRLLAKAYRDGRLIATEKLETTGAPDRIQLAPDRTTLRADAEDAVVVPVSILDAKGRLVPYAANRVHFQLSGGGRLLGVGNGNPADHDPDHADQRDAFHGHCIAVIQAGSHPGRLRVTATSPGLKPASVTFRIQ